MPLQIKNETLKICDEKNSDGSEDFRLISKQISDNTGFSARAHINNPSIQNRDVVLKIFSTLSFEQNDETANWKTYTNTDFKYSFQYPSSWFEKSAVLDNSSPVFERPDTRYYDSYISKGSKVFVLVRNSAKSLDEIEKEYRLSTPIPNSDSPKKVEVEKRINVSGKDALRTIDSVGVRALVYTFVYQGKEYSISCNYLPEDNEDFKECELILSTFKFLE